MTSWTARLLALIVFAVAPSLTTAQTTTTQTTEQPTAPTQPQFKPEELEQLVSPIALYPDTLLAEVLAASTYPLEIVNAQRWLANNKNLNADQLKTAIEAQTWEKSIKSLAATPSVLEMMNTKLEWTQKLGDAVLAQQADVMDAIQRLRSKAQARNKLTTTKQQKVTTQTQNNKQVIVIEPTEPNTVYVPYYDPAVVYGAWPYPAYPPYYFGYPGYIGAGIVATGLAFGAGYALGRWVSGGNFWGGGLNWGNNNININRSVNVGNINVGNRWEHNVNHRHGVRYNNPQVANRYGNNNIRNSAQQRMDFRGRDGNQVLRPGGGDRAVVGDRMQNRPGGGDRANAGDRMQNRPGGDRGAANRPSTGDRMANRPDAGNRGDRAGDRAGAGNRPEARGGNRGGARDGAFGNMQSGRVANFQSQRGHASFASRGGMSSGASFAGRSGGASFAGRGGGIGRRSDVAVKYDIGLLGRMHNGIGLYRFSYLGSSKAHVGVMAHEVQSVLPNAVVLGRDGILRVRYDRLGLTMQSYDRWIATGAKIPAASNQVH